MISHRLLARFSLFLWVFSIGYAVSAHSSVSSSKSVDPLVYWKNPAIPPPVIPVKEIKPGMRGYGLTVFRGYRPEKFEVVVVDVLKKHPWALDHDLILVRMKGGPITQRQANIMAGMSGSPIFLNGRLAGAVSMMSLFPKEPMALVTPIEDMLEALDPHLPQKPLVASALSPSLASAPFVTGNLSYADYLQKILNSGEKLEGPLAPSPEELPWVSSSPSASLQELQGPIPMVLSGLSPTTLRYAQQLFTGMGMKFVTTGGAGATNRGKNIPIGPGSAIGVAYLTGDILLWGYGTVTYRKGNKILAFGHPMSEPPMGPMDLPMARVVINDIFSSWMRSAKWGSFVDVIGTWTQDRPWAIAGELHRKPSTVPAIIRIADRTLQRTQVFRVNVADHPLLTSSLLWMATMEALYRVHSFPGDVMARVRVSLKPEGIPTVIRENLYYAPGDVYFFATLDLFQMVSLIARNPFKNVNFERMEVDVEITPGRNTISVERVTVDKQKVEPGETIKVTVQLRPWGKPTFFKTFDFRIPENAPNGTTTLSVYGGLSGPVAVSIAGPPSGVSGPIAISSTLPYEDLQQMIQRLFLERDTNNLLVARLVLNTPSLNIRGQKLLRLPSPLAEVMRSPKGGGYRPEIDEVKVRLPMKALMMGGAAVPITIERKSMRENGRPVRRPAPAPPPPQPPTPGSTGSQMVNISPEEGDIGGDRNLPSDPSGGEEEALKADSPNTPPPQPKLEQNQPRPHQQPQRGNQQSSAPPSEKKEDSEQKPSGPATAEKGPGRQAVLWTQRTKQQFELGDVIGAGVTSEGDVRLAPVVERIKELTEDNYIWTILPEGKDTALLGTGNYGRIYRVHRNGTLQLLYDSPEVGIHSLARDSQGNLYAGTAPNGIIFKISPSGQAIEWVKTGEKYVLCLAVGPDGTVYAGTGPKGRIYAISPQGVKRLFFTTRENHVLCLVVGPKGEIYAGCSEEAIVYRIDPQGKGSALADLDDRAVTALTVDSAGNIYAGTSPKGMIVRISPQGETKTLYQISNSAVMGLALRDNGQLYAVAGTNIYRISPDEVVTELDNDDQNQFLCLGVDGDDLWAGSGNVASVYHIGGRPNRGEYLSPVRDTGNISRWGRISWQAVLPEGTSIKLQTRTGNTIEPDPTWSDWSPVYTDPSGSPITSPSARYIQYRAILESSNGASPQLKSVTISYLPANRGPKVNFTEPNVGDVLSGTKTIRWTATDPDKDVLTYELYYSRDGGKTWERIDGETKEKETKPSAPSQPPSAETREGTAKPEEKPLSEEQVLAQVTEEIQKDPTLSPEEKQLLDSFLPQIVREAVGKSPKPERPVPVAMPGAGSSGRVIKETSFSWDTTQVPDGEYFLKVIATDRRSNPTDWLSDEAILGPVLVVNERPKLFPGPVMINSARQIKVEGLVTAKLPIATVSYRIDNGDWIAAQPVDGVFDSPRESFQVITDSLTPGDHSLEIRVVDLANNAATEKVSVKVPG